MQLNSSFLHTLTGTSRCVMSKSKRSIPHQDGMSNSLSGTELMLKVLSFKLQ